MLDSVYHKKVGVVRPDPKKEWQEKSWWLKRLRRDILNPDKAIHFREYRKRFRDIVRYLERQYPEREEIPALKAEAQAMEESLETYLQSQGESHATPAP